MNKNAIIIAVVAVVAIAAVAAFLLLGNGDKNYNGGNGDKPVVDGKSSWSKSQCPYADTNADEKVAFDNVSLEKRSLNGERSSMSYNNSYLEAMRAEYDAMGSCGWRTSGTKGSTSSRPSITIRWPSSGGSSRGPACCCWTI